MNFTRFAITAIQISGCMAAAQLGAIGYPIAGFFIAIAMVLLAWVEGSHGWGKST